MGMAFKLLCDEYGRVFGVEAGEGQYIQDAKPGDLIGIDAVSVTLGPRDDNGRLGPLTVREIVVKPIKPADGHHMLCCWRYIGGRWVCVPC